VMVAAKGARLGIPETGVGLFAGAGALFRLPRQVGYNLAMELALTADPITAERGYDLGLVNRLAEPGQAVDLALQLAERIARNAPLALAASKRIIRESWGMADDDFWPYQQPILDQIFGSSDAIEGATAFAEKRDPNWQGR
jgi:enoyl-CoA hydratase